MRYNGGSPAVGPAVASRPADPTRLGPPPVEMRPSSRRPVRGREAASAHHRYRSFAHLHWLPASVLVVLLLVTVAATLVTRAVVSDQDRRLLNERATEVSLVLNTSLSSVPATLAALGHVARDGGTALFTKEAAQDVAASPRDVAFALLRRQAGGFVVVAEAGPGLWVGERVPGVAASVVAAAQKGSKLVATPVIGSGAHRLLGFAMAGPAAPPGTILYRQSALGQVKAPLEAGTAPFHELGVVLYDASRPGSSEVLVTTTKDVPLRGPVQYLPFIVGASHWLLAVSSPHPLVGSVAASAPWVALAVGLIGAVLIASTLEQVVRRRDAAVALYRSEHRVAETLQHKLLPTLSALPGLDIASRYVAAADGQQVGGDWFDVFEIGAGKTAVVIGDVMGHDIEAAAAMAQVRAGLRAYAWEGGEPGLVIERLARFVDAFSVTGLVTVVYGVLDALGDGGARWFRWANAGHLPPLVQLPDRQVHELRDGNSGVIGAPTPAPRGQGARLLPPGSTLVLYTDGLVERPGVTLTGSIEQLRASLQRQRSGTSANEVCEALLRAVPTEEARDDIAIVAVRLLPDGARGNGRATETVSAPGPRPSRAGR